jgi:hypothetical protein
VLHPLVRICVCNYICLLDPLAANTKDAEDADEEAEAASAGRCSLPEEIKYWFLGACVSAVRSCRTILRKERTIEKKAIEFKYLSPSAGCVRILHVNIPVRCSSLKTFPGGCNPDRYCMIFPSPMRSQSSKVDRGLAGWSTIDSWEQTPKIVGRCREK